MSLAFEDRPPAKLSFVYQDGRRGSLLDYLGQPVALLVANLGCPVCQSAIATVSGVVADQSMGFLTVVDQGSVHAASETMDPAISSGTYVAYAPLPEIYLGLKIPRGTWIRYPSLIVLDADNRVCVFSNDPNEITDPERVDCALREVQASGRAGGA